MNKEHINAGDTELLDLPLCELVMRQEFNNDPDIFEKNIEAFVKKVKCHYMAMKSFTHDNDIDFKEIDHRTTNMSFYVGDDEYLKEHVAISFIFSADQFDNPKIILSNLYDEMIIPADSTLMGNILQSLQENDKHTRITINLKDDIHNEVTKIGDKYHSMYNYKISNENLLLYILTTYNYYDEMLKARNDTVIRTGDDSDWLPTDFTTCAGNGDTIEISLVENFESCDNEYHFILSIIDGDRTDKFSYGTRVFLGNVFTSQDVLTYVSSRRFTDDYGISGEKFEIGVPEFILIRIYNILDVAGLSIGFGDIREIIVIMYQLLKSRESREVK